MRLFTAINFNADARSRLASMSDELRADSERGNFSLPENIHLMLVFIGECDALQTDAAKSAMDAVIFEPFDIQIERVGRFKRRGGDIWWAGLRENKPLLTLQRELSDSLRAAGFAIETLDYTPHITLGREVVSDIRARRIEPFGETVHRIDLMKSERIGGSLTYASIYRRGKWKHRIVVEPYSPQWATEFEKIRAFLMPHIGDLVVDIHHVGSTSVVGLSAKPIIDFDIEIASMDVFPELRERLGRLNFRHEGNYGIEAREVFKREVADEFMTYHMYVCPSDSPELARHLKFRNALRADPVAVGEYGALKVALSERLGNDIDAYVDAKTEFILGILAKS